MKDHSSSLLCLLLLFPFPYSLSWTLGNNWRQRESKNSFDSISSNHSKTHLSEEGLQSLLGALDTAADTINHISQTNKETFPLEEEYSVTPPFPTVLSVLEDPEADVIELSANDTVSTGVQTNTSDVYATREYYMESYSSDLETKIVFSKLKIGSCHLHCTVKSNSSKLFFDDSGQQKTIQYLPTIYLVDGREDCHGLVHEGGIVKVKFIGAIRFAGIVSADISDVIKFEELFGRCIIILLRRNFMILNDGSNSLLEIPIEGDKEIISLSTPGISEIVVSTTTSLTSSSKPSTTTSKITIEEDNQYYYGDELEEYPSMYFDEINTTTYKSDDYHVLSNELVQNELKPPLVSSLLSFTSTARGKGRTPKNFRMSRSRSIYFDEEGYYLGPLPKIVGLLDRRIPSGFRSNAFISISLSSFSIITTGSIADLKVAPVVTIPLLPPIVSPVHSITVSSSSEVGSVLNSWSTFPLIQLPGLTATHLFIMTLLVIIFYAFVIYFTSANSFFSEFLSASSLTRNLGQNLRRNILEEISHSGNTVSWIIDSITNYFPPKVHQSNLTPNRRKVVTWNQLNHLYSQDQMSKKDSGHLFSRISNHRLTYPEIYNNL